MPVFSGELSGLGNKGTREGKQKYCQVDAGKDTATSMAMSSRILAACLSLTSSVQELGELSAETPKTITLEKS
jgi:hypothetical protein